MRERERERQRREERGEGEYVDYMQMSVCVSAVESWWESCLINLLAQSQITVPMLYDAEA